MRDERLLLFADGMVENFAIEAGDIMGIQSGGLGLGDQAGEQVFLALDIAEAAVALESCS